MKAATHEQDIARFESRFEKKGPDECWPWLGCLRDKNRKDTRGVIEIKGKHMIASRASYLFYKGEIPEGMFVCHSCDCELCVNPAHLWLGTPKQNSEDREKKGRGLKGRHLPEWQVEFLRKINTGKVHSEETKKRISLAKMGCKGFTGKHTEETKLKISKANSGRKYTEEERLRRSQIIKKPYRPRKEKILVESIC